MKAKHLHKHEGQLQRRLIPLAALALLLLALLDFASQVTIDEALSGDPFFYWGYVNHHLRPPLLLVGFWLLVIWGFMRLVWRPLRALSWLAAIILALACVIFTLLTPLRSLNSSAFHIQSQPYDDRLFHSFYQSENFLDEQCVHVVVVCDGAGLMCRYLDQWQYGPLCMGEFAPIRLAKTGVTVDDELVLRWQNVP